MSGPSPVTLASPSLEVAMGVAVERSVAEWVDPVGDLPPRPGST
ncbi:MAG TPA: hypothetical protein VFJ22_14540 [Dermatophilaceae bacterium]|nr:hypothetical protein [Dermatophilaceae bacterium]